IVLWVRVYSRGRPTKTLRSTVPTSATPSLALRRGLGKRIRPWLICWACSENGRRRHLQIALAFSVRFDWVAGSKGVRLTPRPLRQPKTRTRSVSREPARKKLTPPGSDKVSNLFRACREG